MEEIAIRLPPRRPIMAGMNARNVRKTPSRSVATVSRQSSSVISCSGCVGPATPALATTARTGPSASAPAAIAATDASSRTSQASGSAVPPAFPAASTVSARLAGSLALAATVNPPAASATAIARPMPRLAPVTTATGLLTPTSRLPAGPTGCVRGSSAAIPPNPSHPATPWQERAEPGRRPQPVRPGLRGEGGVAAVLGQQAGVGAGLGDAAVVQDGDLVGAAHGGQPGGDGDGGAAPGQGGERPPDRALRLRVPGAG